MRGIDELLIAKLFRSCSAGYSWGIDAGVTLREFRAAAGLSQMALAVKVGVTLPAVSGWERNLYRPRRPTAQRLDDELHAGGSILAAFGFAPLPSPPPGTSASEADGHVQTRVQRLEQIVDDLAHRLNEIQEALIGSGGRLNV